MWNFLNVKPVGAKGISWRLKGYCR